MRSLLIILTLAGVFEYQAYAQQCTHRIFFLPQTHDADPMTGIPANSEERNAAAYSQWKIADFIERFPGLPVFSENAGAKDHNWEVFPADQREQTKANLKQLINEEFPKGIPSRPEYLTPTQKERFIVDDADSVQMIRGRISEIKRVVEDSETMRQILEPIKEWYKAHPGDNRYSPQVGVIVYGARERQALIQVNKFLATNPNQKDVILIYGSNHSFYFYPDLFPPQCVIVPDEFQSEWTGRFRSGPEGFPQTSGAKGPLPIRSTVR